MKPYKPHESMRGYFAFHLYEEMERNTDIYVVVADLGYGMFDTIQADFSDRFINVGAAEQTMLDVAVGLAMSGKIPVVYTISPFYFRAAETIRTYINHENIPVIMVGSGRGKDYTHDGFSHHAEDIQELMDMFNNVVDFYPTNWLRLKTLVPEIINLKRPVFLSLKR